MKSVHRYHLMLRLSLIVVACCALSGCGAAGTAKDKLQLRDIYRGAGPEMAAFYTNSIFQSLPFSGPIAWQRSTARAPIISLKGRVDAGAWKAFLERRRDLVPDNAFGNPFYLQYGHRVGNWLVITLIRT
jgi:hypothetical protein